MGEVCPSVVVNSEDEVEPIVGNVVSSVDLLSSVEDVVMVIGDIAVVNTDGPVIVDSDSVE